MHKVKDLCAVTRTYSKNGQTKNVWANVGSIFLDDEGNERITIDPFFNFAALQRKDNTDRVWLSAFPVRQKDNSSLQSYDDKHFDHNATLDDEMPF